MEDTTPQAHKDLILERWRQIQANALFKHGREDVNPAINQRLLHAFSLG